MSRDALKRFEEVKGQPCPYVAIEYDNIEAANLTWMALNDRLHGFIPEYTSAALAREKPFMRARIIRRAVHAVQSESAAALLGIPMSDSMPKAQPMTAKPPRVLIPRRPPGS